VLPKLPVSLNDLVLPTDLTKSLYNEQMLFCDQREPSRILAFASLTALKELGMFFFSNNVNNIMLKCSDTDK